MNRPRISAPGHEQNGADVRLGWTLALPALVVTVVFGFLPIAWTFWESLHLHDLRMPWRGRAS
jgi:ABC-type sugar transport system permease subunit